MAIQGTNTYGTRNTVNTGIMKEDLSEVISNISPVDTPFLNAIGKGTCSNTTPNWLVDSLDAAADNAKIEGADVSADYTARNGAVRLANVTQILTKLVEVTGTVEASDTAGKANKMAYQLGIKLKEFANDTEWALLNADYNAGSTSAARKMRSLVGDGVNTGWLNNGTYCGASSLYQWSSTYAATNDLTETIFQDMIQAAWAEGGKPDMVLADPKQKRIISGFYGNTKANINTDSGDKKITNVIDVYESDFGLVRIVPERNFRKIQSPTATFYEFVAILQKDKWEACYLRKPMTEKMAKVGDSDRAMIIAELTLKAKAPKSSALIQRCSQS